jgi:hypothetical protein
MRLAWPNTLHGHKHHAAANWPDPVLILAQAIGLTSTIGMVPCSVLGVMVECAAYALVRHIPAERQSAAAKTLIELLRGRLETLGIRQKLWPRRAALHSTAFLTC